MRAVLVGAGSVGRRAARQLLSTEAVDELVLCHPRPDTLDSVVAALAAPGRVRTAELPRWSSGGARPGPTQLDGAMADAHVVVLALPEGHRVLAEAALERGLHVVSTADTVDEVRDLLALDEEARERGRAVVVGAAFAPGLTCVLARHGAEQFDSVDEIHVASLGTGGPACARHHHNAVRHVALDWSDGAWKRRPSGSGRELVWFPDPVGGADCYRAARADALLLVPAFPRVQRVTARLAATRRDRLTAGLPMLRPPHPEGTLGAVRVELRGQRGPARAATILGAIDRPGLAAGAVASVAAVWAVEGRLARSGAGGLAELLDGAVPFLAELARRGVRAAVFEGDGTQATG